MIDDFVLKIITSFGVPGLALYLAYRLMDKYMGKVLSHFTEFVAQQTMLAQATKDVADVVKAQRDGDRDMVIAMGVLTRKVDEVVGWVREMDERLVKGAPKAA